MRNMAETATGLTADLLPVQLETLTSERAIRAIDIRTEKSVV